MGERPFIPFSDAVKAKADVAVISTSTLGYLQTIPWSEIAAFLAVIYTSLRIAELVIGWLKKRKK